MAKSWRGIRPSSSRVDITDYVDVMQLPDGEWITVRPIGLITSFAKHWVKIRKKDGNTVSIPRICTGYDPETETYDATKCPYCRAGMGRKQKIYVSNFIIRDLQDKKPYKPTKEERKRGYRVPQDSSFSPVRVILIPQSLASNILELAELAYKKLARLFKKKGKELDVTEIDLSHPIYGFDIEIKYDSSKSGTDMYSAQLGERSKLTEEERKYLLYNIEEAVENLVRDFKDEDDFESIKKICAEDIDVDDEEEYAIDDDLDDEPKKKKKKSKKKEKVEEDDDEDFNLDDDEDEDFDFEDDEEEEEKPKKNKKKSKKKKKVEDDDDEDFEEEKPKKKKKKKKVEDEEFSFEDDDDDDFNFDDDEDEDF